ncbi:uncharacterized protein V1516DRAFT_677031 [Lipomyces oligophaga]|uniref:uncharacterized protein n=1 Tax=Lipomyces oligophaga TaxID=45792 RepID=UPI0034CE8055
MPQVETFEDDAEDQVFMRDAEHVLKDHTEIIDIRAYQRTYEGAYLRTAMLEVTLSLSLLRIFDIEFYPIGAWFAIIGFSFMMIGLGRRIANNKHLMSTRTAQYFLTSGTVVACMTTICVIGYIAIIPEIFRL